MRAGRVRGVRVATADGAHTVETDIVVNCAGQWAKAVGALAGVEVPLHSAEHFYVVTDRINGVGVDTPILRDPDGWTYIKEEVGGLVVGGFEPQAKAWRSPDDLPYPFEFQLLPEDWDHFSVLMDSAVHRLPVLEHTGIKKMYNGPESFTPDNQFILGESPTVAGFFVGAGFNSVGIASAGGAGRALAEWIVAGVPTQDLVAVDVRRFGSFHANTTWLRARVTEVLGLHYAVPWPNRELETARPFRRSPVHHRLAAAGAWFGSKMGWERPNYFAPPGHAPQAEYGWGRQNWHDWVVAEQLATRRQVALFDETSFGKLRVSGPDALRLLSLVCAGQVDVEPGRVVYTPMLNSRAGYEADLTVTRVGEDDFLLLTSSASPVRDGDWLRRHSGDGWRVSVEDVSAALAVFGLMGPDSRAVLGQLTSTDLVDFPFGTSRLIEVGPFTVRGTRITYVGELGWELCVPVEFAEDVYALLLQAGVYYGLREAGYYAINALRLDKGYRAFGAELTPDRTPVEAGLVFATRPGGGFIGAKALTRARAEGPRRRMVSLVVDDPQPVLWGGELVRLDGVATGQVTSAAYSATSRSCVGLAYLWNASGEPVTREQIAPTGYTVDVGGQSVPVKVSLRAPYDPDGTRIRG